MIAVDRGRWTVRAVPMPSTERDIWDWFSVLNSKNTIAVIEKVGGFAGVGHPGSRMFNFGKGYGGLRMALIAAGIPFDEISPQTWLNAMRIPLKKRGPAREIINKKGKSQKVPGEFTETGSQWKSRLKARAQQLYPEIDVTLKTADALLIATYCRRREEGKL